MHAPESKFVQTNGIRMHYLDWGGSGPTCIMLHGAAMCGGTWEPMVKRLSHRLRCITPDLRSHGDFDVSKTAISWDLLADDAAGFVKALDLQNVFFVGHSFGAGTLLLGSAQEPHRYAGGYFVEPTLLGQMAQTPEQRAQRRTMRQGVRNKRSVFASRQAMFDTLHGRGMLKIVTDEALWAYVNYGTRELPDGSVELKCSPDSEASFFDAQAEPDAMWGTLAKITYPVTLVYSEARLGDPALRAQIEPVINQFTSVTHGTLEVTPGTHNTIMEYPDVHTKLILDMVDRLERQGRLGTASHL